MPPGSRPRSATLVLLHESLRTRLRTADDGRLDQVVHAAGGIPVVSRPATPDTVTPTAYALRDELLAVPFDAEREWPLRVGVVHVGADAHYVMFSLSHTASDGWGLRNLLADFAALLRGPLPARACGSPWRRPRSRSRTVAAAATPPPAGSWLDKLGRGPASQFPARAGREPAATFPNAVLNSPALGLALDGSRRPCPSARPRSSSPRRPRPPPGSPASTRPSSRSWSTTGSCPAWPAA